MIGIRSQSIPESSIASTDDEICDWVLDTKSCYVRGLGHGINVLLSSCSSGLTSILPTCSVVRDVEAGYWESTMGWAVSWWVGSTCRRVPAASDLDDGVDGVDGMDDAADEAAVGRFELFRALSFPNPFSFCGCRHLMAYLCCFLFLF